MNDSIDKEIEAIKSVLKALQSLNPSERQAVLDYVFKRLDIPSKEIGSQTTSYPDSASKVFQAEETSTGTQDSPIHIKALKEQKVPKSASEMAALVAYYLFHIAIGGDKKEEITLDDLKTYFKIAKYQLPSKMEFTLSNAKKAGYLDAVGDGKYQLNAVGYNLIEHSLPRKRPVRFAKKKSAKKKSAKKKSAKKKSAKKKSAKKK